MLSHRLCACACDCIGEEGNEAWTREASVRSFQQLHTMRHQAAQSWKSPSKLVKPAEAHSSRQPGVSSWSLAPNTGTHRRTPTHRHTRTRGTEDRVEWLGWQLVAPIPRGRQSTVNAGPWHTETSKERRVHNHSRSGIEIDRQTEERERERESSTQMGTRDEN